MDGWVCCCVSGLLLVCPWRRRGGQEGAVSRTRAARQLHKRPTLRQRSLTSHVPHTDAATRQTCGCVAVAGLAHIYMALVAAHEKGDQTPYAAYGHHMQQATALHGPLAAHVAALQATKTGTAGTTHKLSAMAAELTKLSDLYLSERHAKTLAK